MPSENEPPSPLKILSTDASALGLLRFASVVWVVMSFFATIAYVQLPAARRVHSLLFAYGLNILALAIPCGLPLAWWCWVTRRTFRIGKPVTANITNIHEAGIFTARRTITCEILSQPGPVIAVKLCYVKNSATASLRVGDPINVLQDPADPRRCFFPQAYGSFTAA